MLGYAPQEAEPTNAWWRQQVHPDDRERFTQHWQETLVQGDRFVIEYRLRHQAGHFLHVLDRGTLVRDAAGRLVRVVGSCQDISARVHIEQALRASEGRFRFLAESGAALAASLDPAAALETVARVAVPALADYCLVHLADESGELRQVASARAADRRKDEFIAMLAHELRNPLAPIVSSLYMLRRHGEPGGEAASARDTIDRQVRHLTRLVDDLLDVARITRGKVTLRRQPVE